MSNSSGRLAKLLRPIKADTKELGPITRPWRTKDVPKWIEASERDQRWNTAHGYVRLLLCEPPCLMDRRPPLKGSRGLATTRSMNLLPRSS
jgi:hypothetical protein